VYQALGRFNGRYQLGAWITRIATNVCLDQLRSRARRPADVVQLDVVDLEDDRHHEPDGPEFLTIRRAESHRVRRVLAELPPMHRAAIVLRDFEGLSYAEVAVALGMTEGQVKALIHRARQNFKRSWTPLSVLMPWRLLSKAKEVDGTTREHVAQAVTTSAQLVPACTTALQQCGQYVAERVAPVFTAAVLGAAVGGAAVAKSSQPVAKPRSGSKATAVADRADSGSLLGSAQRQKPMKTRVARKDAAPAPVVEEGEPEDPVTSPKPTPAASPSETPAASPSPTPSSSPTAPPKPTKPERASFAAALGFERGGPPPAVVPTADRTYVDCDPIDVVQRLESTFADGADSYPAVFSLRANSSSVSIQLSIWKEGREIYYSGGGSLTGGTRTGDQLVLEFTGSYRTGNQEARDSLGLPDSGDFRATMTLDCAWSELISETVTFSG
jgi:RNA polymerase sigma factor (sigma-70 family)